MRGAADGSGASRKAMCIPQGGEVAMYARVRQRARVFLYEEQGPTATEYAVMFSIILLGALVGITTIGSKVNTKFSEARQGW